MKYSALIAGLATLLIAVLGIAPEVDRGEFFAYAVASFAMYEGIAAREETERLRLAILLHENTHERDARAHRHDGQ